ncbi:hypothetical protein QNH20_25645 [Neobacillus sp. WH10]|uniref:hypothetical protein n=1 Tax=Neobacillus sp. WH10 TaxID=3047873 RepID=UPI0024C1A782|nr:hypothetical protein [Neobacillus sp. WH10]WHY77404.1 hypothetical protein QNH20_25645 [Neobacillus sp. WH10]
MQKIKRFWVLLVGSVLLLGYPGVAAAGWALEGGKWHYYDHGLMKVGWLLEDGRWYYLDQSGAMKTGWVSDGGKWYFLDRSGAMKTGWVLVDGKWYYLDQSGAMKTGWVLVDGKWYFLDRSGVMKTGWVWDNGKWYNLSSSGAMRSGWLMDKGSSYFLDQSGAMVTGWKSISDDWYYFDKWDGAMKRQNFVGGYYLMADGRMTNAGNAEVVSAVEDLKKWIDVGLTKLELQEKLGASYHDLVGIEGDKYWQYTLKVTDAGNVKAVKWDADDFGTEDLAKGSADIIVLAYWDGDGKAFRVSMDYFNKAHKFHHYYSAKYDYEYN